MKGARQVLARGEHQGTYLDSKIYERVPAPSIVLKSNGPTRAFLIGFGFEHCFQKLIWQTSDEFESRLLRIDVRYQLTTKPQSAVFVMP